MGKCLFIFISVRMGVTFQSLLHIMNIGDIMYRLCCDYIQYFICLFIEEVIDLVSIKI